MTSPARWLLRLTLAGLPPRRRDWARAMLAEADSIKDPREQAR